MLTAGSIVEAVAMLLAPVAVMAPAVLARKPAAPEPARLMLRLVNVTAPVLLRISTPKAEAPLMLTSLNLNAPVELLLMRMPWGPLEAIWAPSTVTSPWALDIAMPLPVSVNGAPG